MCVYIYILHASLTDSGMGFPGGSVVKNLPANTGDSSLVSGLERSSGEGNGNPLQYSCLGNPRDGGAWWATVHRVTKESDSTKQPQLGFTVFAFSFRLSLQTELMANRTLIHVTLFDPLKQLCKMSKGCPSLFWGSDHGSVSTQLNAQMGWSWSRSSLWGFLMPRLRCIGDSILSRIFYWISENSQVWDWTLP